MIYEDNSMAITWINLPPHEGETGMAYSNFTLRDVQKIFQLTLHEEMGLFAQIEPMAISEPLTLTLSENVPLAVSMNTEKARSELIVVNVLLELRKLFQRQVSLFSGVEFTVD